MAAVDHICRRARREDLRRAMSVWAQDRALYDAEVWGSFPALLEDLLERDLVSFALIESVPGRVPRLLGGISFVRPEYIAQARSSACTLPNYVLQAALRNHNPFLSPKDIAKENARGELNLMTFFGNIDVIDLADPGVADFYRTSNEGHRFFLFGYSFRAMWSEVSSRHHSRELEQQGMRIDRELQLPGGRTTTLMRLTREDALANPYARFSCYFFPPKPRFGFSLREQRLLEYALLEASDTEAAAELHVSEEAIKKRWRSIYTKIENADPNLLSASASGAVRRRTVLRCLRQHLEELRPYRQECETAKP